MSPLTWCDERWGEVGQIRGHDPVIIKEVDKYYVFSTDTGGRDHFKAGIQIRKSSGLIHWRFVARAFSDGVLKEAYDWAEAKGLWVGEIVRLKRLKGLEMMF
jgi:arabinan endo-1,5-alpha-L-arabinosidase